MAEAGAALAIGFVQAEDEF